MEASCFSEKVRKIEGCGIKGCDVVEKEQHFGGEIVATEVLF